MTSSVVDSTGNVFSDLGLPSSETDMLKISMAQAISMTVQELGLTQAQAAGIIGADKAKVSALLKGRLKGFTIDRLVSYLLLLGRDIDVKISGNHQNKPGRIRIKAA